MVTPVQAVKDVNFRVRKAQFGDGYTQVDGDGIHPKTQKWELLFVGNETYIRAIVDFLDHHGGYKSFQWTPQLADAGLYRCDAYKTTAFGADILRFHNETIPYTSAELKTDQLPKKSLWWQGKEYGPWPVSIEGLDMSSDGQSARPKLTVANIDGLITALCLRFDDMVQAKVTIHDTFVHYLDAANFPNGNPGADPEQERTQVFYIDRKESEDDEAVKFELASPADLQGLKIPTRQIHSSRSAASPARH